MMVKSMSERRRLVFQLKQKETQELKKIKEKRPELTEIIDEIINERES